MWRGVRSGMEGCGGGGGQIGVGKCVVGCGGLGSVEKSVEVCEEEGVHFKQQWSMG